MTNDQWFTLWMTLTQIGGTAAVTTAGVWLTLNHSRRQQQTEREREAATESRAREGREAARDALALESWRAVFTDGALTIDHALGRAVSEETYQAIDASNDVILAHQRARAAEPGTLEYETTGSMVAATTDLLVKLGNLPRAAGLEWERELACGLQMREQMNEHRRILTAKIRRLNETTDLTGIGGAL